MTATAERAVHPAAALFPMLPDDELDELAADIKANGQIHPIIVDGAGQVIDGRNRLEACRRAGVEPRFENLNGQDPVSFILSANVARRHMTSGQRAIAVASILIDAGRRENGRWKYGSIPEVCNLQNASTWNSALARAGTIIDHAPELAAAVLSGVMPLSKAHEQAQMRKQEAENHAEAEKRRKRAEAETERQRKREVEEAQRDATAALERQKAKLEDLRRGAPDLAALVEEERMALPEACAAFEIRKKEAYEAAVRRTKDAAQAIMMVHATLDQEHPENLLDEWVPEVNPYPSRHQNYWDLVWSPEALRNIGGRLIRLADAVEAKEVRL